MLLNSVFEIDGLSRIPPWQCGCVAVRARGGASVSDIGDSRVDVRRCRLCSDEVNRAPTCRLRRPVSLEAPVVGSNQTLAHLASSAWFVQPPQEAGQRGSHTTPQLKLMRSGACYFLSRLSGWALSPA